MMVFPRLDRDLDNRQWLKAPLPKSVLPSGQEVSEDGTQGQEVKEDQEIVKTTEVPSFA